MTNIGVIPAVVLYEGINTTGTLVERGVVFTLTPAQIRIAEGISEFFNIRFGC